jgi:hypothetical protein
MYQGAFLMRKRENPNGPADVLERLLPQVGEFGGDAAIDMFVRRA